MRAQPTLLAQYLLVLAIAGGPPATAQCNQAAVGATPGVQADGFAESFDVDGPWVVVGAPEDDQLWADAGAAYVFHEQPGGWSQEAKLVPADLAPGSNFSHAQVAISYPWVFAGSLWEPAPDGSGGGVVRVYRHDPALDSWDLQQRLWLPGVGSSAGFGGRIEVHSGTLFVTARGLQEVHLFRLHQGQWAASQVLTDPEPAFQGDWLGTSIAAAEGGFVTATVRPTLGLVAYRFDPTQPGAPGSGYAFAERIDFPVAAIEAGTVAVGRADVAVMARLGASGEQAHVLVAHREPDRTLSFDELTGPTPATTDFGRALAFVGDGDEELFVGARAFAGAVGPLGQGLVHRRIGPLMPLESEFRAKPSYPQLRFATAARSEGERIFVASAEAWWPGTETGRIDLFERLPEVSLSADVDQLSLSAGGVQLLRLSGCPELSGLAYVVVGSLSLSPLGGQPQLGLHSLPLAPDAWTLASLELANSLPFGATLGVLAPGGAALAGIAVPPSSPAALAGTDLYHAAVVFDPWTGTIEATSVPVTLHLMP
jgi:hypothetical protein